MNNQNPQQYIKDYTKRIDDILENMRQIINRSGVDRIGELKKTAAELAEGVTEMVESADINPTTRIENQPTTFGGGDETQKDEIYEFDGDEFSESE